MEKSFTNVDDVCRWFKFDQESVGKQIMWLNKKESSKGQRYILQNSRDSQNIKVESIHQSGRFLVWGNPVQGKPFVNANK